MSHLLLIIFASLVLGFLFGWEYAHSTVSKECRRLGGFYVGSTVFKCVEIKEQP